MINKTIKIEKKEGGKLLPEDIYNVELFDVNIEQGKKFQSEELENKLSFLFVILDGKDGEEDLRGRILSKKFVPMYLYIGKNGKNMLFQIVEALLGRELTREQIANFTTDNIDQLIGMQCRVTVKDKQTAQGNTFSNIEGLLRSKEEIKPLTSKEKEAVKKIQNDYLKAKKNTLEEKIEEIPVLKGTKEELEEINIEEIPF